MSARDRIGRIEPDNLPPAARRRRPPDDDPAPATPPPAPAAPAPAPVPDQPAVPGRDLAPATDTPDFASMLADMLANSGNPDTNGGGGQQTTGHASSGPSVPLSALTTPPPVDPELDLVALSVRVPRYAAEAVRLKAFLGRRKHQDVVRDALLGRDPIQPELLDECRRSAAGS